MTSENLSIISGLVKKAKEYPDAVIEATVIEYVKRSTGKRFVYQGKLQLYYPAHQR